MAQREYRNLEEVEIEYQNKITKVIALRDIPEMELAGRHIPPTAPGGELEIPFWAAEEMAHRDYVKYSEKEDLTLQELSKTHWRETIPSPQNLPRLDDRFNCKLRRLLQTLNEESRSHPDRLKDYEKARSISNEIIDCRLKKIATLAASQYKSGEVIRNLTPEEKVLFNLITQTIEYWREKVMWREENGEHPREP